jgi:hypothetical protein
VSEGQFEAGTLTKDAPAAVLGFYQHSIDPNIWVIGAVGARNLAFHSRTSPSIHGGVDAHAIAEGTYVTVWVTDMRVPAAFPVDFPIAYRARPIEDASVVDGVYVLRWDIGGNAGDSRFMSDYADVLGDAGWDVLTKSAEREPRQFLTCRRRSDPRIGCSVTIAFEYPYGTHTMPPRRLAIVRVGPGADSAP